MDNLPAQQLVCRRRVTRVRSKQQKIQIDNLKRKREKPRPAGI